jgi:sugar lactone lactonase YvrE
MRKQLLLILAPILLVSLACALPFAEPKIDGTVPLPENTTPSTPPLPDPTFSPEPGLPASPVPEADNLIRQGASRSRLDPYEIDDVALWPLEEAASCGDEWLSSLDPSSGEIILALTYSAPLRAEQLELYVGSDPHGIRRIELLNSLSGLGKLVYESGQSIQASPISGVCAQKLTVPASADFEVDTVFISFENPAAVAQLGGVEMLGRLEAYVEAPVFWRVPLSGTPVGLAVNQTGLVFAATEPDGLSAYDVEGNLVKQISVPSEAQLTDVAADPFGNFVVVDDGYGWFILMTPEGEHLTVGGTDVFGAAAVSPLNGNLYLLMGSQIHVYTADTGEFLRLMPLDDLHTHTSLAFAPDGRLFTLRDYDWDAALLELDPLTGAEGDSISLRRSNITDTLVRDLAIDAAGNFYILYGINAAQIAVHVLSPDGVLIKRFGKLAYDFENIPEGEFFDPRAIAVSPDGRFVLVADGYEDNSSLTTFLLETEP